MLGVCNMFAKQCEVEELVANQLEKDLNHL